MSRKVNSKEAAKKNKMRRRLFERQGGICPRCLEPLPKSLPRKEVALDHILPRSKGGKDGIDNRQLLHRCCDQAKGDHLEEPWDGYANQSAPVVSLSECASGD
jgi:5-methylcytosine-specific restriction endonuclease McrA